MRLDAFAQDLRAAIRNLRRSTGFAVLTILTLSVGIGANTAIFSVLNAVVLRTLPIPDSDRLFAVRTDAPVASGNRFSGPMFERLRQSVPPGAAVAAMSRVARVYARPQGSIEPEPAALQLVSPNYFQVIGALAGFGARRSCPSSPWKK